MSLRFIFHPNIHPLKEYLIRKEENIRFAQKFGIPFIDADYDRQQWFDRAKVWNGNLNVAFAVPCVLICVLKKRLNMLMNMVSLYLLAALVFLVGKIWIKINGCGHRAAEKYDDVIYWDYNWRKAGGSQRMIEISKRERFLSTGILWLCLFFTRQQ